VQTEGEIVGLQGRGAMVIGEERKIGYYYFKDVLYRQEEAVLEVLWEISVKYVLGATQYDMTTGTLIVMTKLRDLERIKEEKKMIEEMWEEETLGRFNPERTFQTCPMECAVLVIWVVDEMAKHVVLALDFVEVVKEAINVDITIDDFSICCCEKGALAWIVMAMKTEFIDQLLNEKVFQLNYKDYTFGRWRDYVAKRVICKVSLVPLLVKLLEFAQTLLRLTGVHAVEVEFMFHKNNYKDMVQIKVENGDQLVKLTQLELLVMFESFPPVQFQRQMTKDKYRKVPNHAIITKKHELMIEHTNSGKNQRQLCRREGTKRVLLQEAQGPGHPGEG